MIPDNEYERPPHIGGFATDEKPIATTSKRVVTLLLDVLHGHGVKEAVCSPGSRNIPLLLGIDADKNIHYQCITDERSAAFVGLGLAISTGSPVMIVCTSGTALLNYAPAAAEAFYQGVPLIIVSADRPEEWIDQDDSQTIKQYGALGNIVKKSYDISDTDLNRPEGEWYAERIFNDAMLVANSGKKGPVHINIRLTPPLEETTYFTPAKARIISNIPVLTQPDRMIIKGLAELAVDKRVMLVAGFMDPDAKTNTAVNRFRQHSNVVVMAETISNLHLPAQDYAIDTLLRSDRPEYPELVISIGGAIISRMLKEYLRNIPDKGNLIHWSVGYNHTTVDCFKSLTATIVCDPGIFISRLSAEMAHIIKKRGYNSLASGYAEKINSERSEAITSINHEVEDCQWCEAKAFKKILELIPHKDNVCISNGTAIRYSQLFTRRLQHAQYCNRGVSGIDGSTSTAVGISLGYKGNTWLVSGDMSFTYDVNGLEAARKLDPRLNIVVINNNGGGIFRFIKSSRGLDIREKMLCGGEIPTIRLYAEMYNFDYYRAESEIELEKALKDITMTGHRSLLEIGCDPEYSASVLRGLLKQ